MPFSLNSFSTFIATSQRLLTECLLLDRCELNVSNPQADATLTDTERGGNLIEAVALATQSLRGLFFFDLYHHLVQIVLDVLVFV